MQIHFRATHVYPGAIASLLEDEAATGMEHVSVLVEFSDGVSLLAKWSRTSPTRAVLAIPAYVTGRGAAVVARIWTMTQRSDGLWKAVSRKLA